jgi:S1-C subfamily serine protease
MSTESSQPSEKSIVVEFSDSLADAVALAGQSIVQVSARRRVGATGLIWSADGLIVTADHVIQRVEEIEIGLPDGRDIAARLIGRDPGTDIAVLKVDAGGLTPAVPSATESKVGHLVLALGRPFGGSPMATMGIVSAAGGAWRTWRGGRIEGVVRSDVTLYPGFSGGPLIDGSGRVIGMNSSALARGLAVTVPHAVLRRVAQALTSQGKVRHGYLGIAAQPVGLPDSLRQRAGLTVETGLLLVGVEPGSPADRAGLLLGDILVAFAGGSTGGLEALNDRLGPDSVGTQQVAKIVRGGEVMDITVTVGER